MQDWVTATDIMIVLTKPGAADVTDASKMAAGGGTDGMSNALPTSPDHGMANDMIPQAQPLIQQQPPKGEAIYFAMSDLAVGGRCKCNGHASRCLEDTNTGKLVCDCRHNTAGTDCERCKPFHYERPWARSTAKDANECIGTSKHQHTHVYIYENVSGSGQLCIYGREVV